MCLVVITGHEFYMANASVETQCVFEKQNSGDDRQGQKKCQTVASLYQFFVHLPNIVQIPAAQICCEVVNTNVDAITD